MTISNLPRASALVVAAVLTLTAPAIAQTVTQSAGQFTLEDLKIGSPVFGTDGIRVGEINRIKADASGRVLELQVTTGGPAGLNAEVVAITPDKIASPAGTDVKLSLSAADAKKLPVVTDDQRG